MNIEEILSAKPFIDSKQQSSENSYNYYQSVLASRYASDQMSALFSQQTRHATWRYIWYVLAQAQKEMGLPITQEQLDQMHQNIHTIDFQAAQQYEKKFRHDVMAHIHTFGDQCPKARGIIHLGATSCLITDNADILIAKQALHLIKKKLVTLIKKLSDVAEKYQDVECLSFTHFQPAQPTTVGKRITVWLHDIVLDFNDLEYRLDTLALLGLKGATGTQASFLELFEGDHTKVQTLENIFVKKLAFDRVVPISGQTYTRKQDVHILHLLAGISISAHKMSTDLRLLAHMHEIEEPFDKDQVGSSAMPYKKNPMKNERVCSLARYVISLTQCPEYTAALQWLERTLDDSANRRLFFPEAFLATDALLDLLINIVEHSTINPEAITYNLTRELPFMAMENILMACVKKGADRQMVHEQLKIISMQARHALQSNNNFDFFAHIIANPTITLTQEELHTIMDKKNLSGRASAQVQEFLCTVIKPLVKKYETISCPTTAIKY